MPTKNPRINVVLESSLYNTLCRLAHNEGVSLSLFSRDLIKEALEIREDIHWQKEAHKRDKTFSRRKSLSHKDVWR
jgi:hypothetical protein